MVDLPELPPIVKVEKELASIPDEYKLFQNYPNPFNPSTNIEFMIKQSEIVELKVYDILGRELAVLVSEHLPAGKYTYQFDAAKLSSGIYFYRISAGSFIDIKKAILIK